jgi:hypothetical protein
LLIYETGGSRKPIKINIFKKLVVSISMCLEASHNKILGK